MNVHPLPVRKRLADWYAAGFKEVISVIPPGAQLSPNTTVEPQHRGKVPGEVGPYGWRSFDWQNCVVTEDRIARWDGDSPNVGLRAAYYPGVDIDVTDPQLSAAITAAALQVLGPAPSRTGRAPKRLLSYRLAEGQEPLLRRRLWFRDTSGNPHLIEMLGQGQQYVVDGKHPTTGKPYLWDRHPVETGPEALTPITAEKIDDFFRLVEFDLRLEGCDTFEPEGTGSEARDRASTNQDTLKAPALAAVAEAVRALPNPEETDRTQYLKIGYAIKASLPDDPEDAYDLFEEWALRWPGEDNPEKIRSDWERMKGPYSVGWPFLAENAVPHGFDLPSTQFEALDNLPEKKPSQPPSLTEMLVASGQASVSPEAEKAEPAPEPAAGEQAAPAAPTEEQAVEPEKMETKRHAPTPKRLPEGFSGASIPPRPWVLGRRFLAGAVTAGVGAPGVSKSTMSLLTALSIATGRELTGEKVYKTGRVWVHNNEDDENEIERRVAAMCKHYSIDPAEIRDNFLYSSGVLNKLRIAVKNGDHVTATEAAKEIVLTMREENVVYWNIDPFVSVHSGVSENSNDEIESVIGYIREIAALTGATIDLVHHTVKNHTGNTEARAGDANASRGAGALIGAVRISYTLAAMAEETAAKLGISLDVAASLVRLDGAKGNYSARSFEPKWFRLVSVDIGNGDPESEDNDLLIEGDSVGVPEIFDVAKLAEEARSCCEAAAKLRETDVLQVVMDAMPRERCKFIDVVPAVMKALDVKETKARDEIKRAIGAKAEVVAHGFRWELKMQTGVAGGGTGVIISRKAVG